MRYSLSPGQKNFFKNNRLLPLYDLLTPSEIEAVKGVDFPASCRNFWQKSPVIANLIRGRARSELASQIFDQQTLRVAFDELIIGTGKPPIPGHISLRDISSVQGTVGAALVNLGCEAAPPLPENLGDITYFSSNALLPMEYIYSPGTRFLLIVYCDSTPVYKHNPKEPRQRYFHSMGYDFGDRLSEETSPVVLK